MTKSDLYSESSRNFRRCGVLCSKIDFMLRENLIDAEKHEGLLHLLDSPDNENLTIVETIVDSILLT